MTSNLPEEWRPVVGYEGTYEVSNLGRVRRIKPYQKVHPDKCLTQSLRRGYLSVGLSIYSKTRSYTVHTLVAAAFIGPRPIKHFIDHVDGNKTNNRSNNLEYVLPAENDRRAVALGLKATGARNGSQLHPEAVPKGEKHGHSILTAASVLEIRWRLEQGESGRALGREFGVHFTTISDIRRRKSWRHL